VKLRPSTSLDGTVVANRLLPKVRRPATRFHPHNTPIRSPNAPESLSLNPTKTVEVRICINEVPSRLTREDGPRDESLQRFALMDAFATCRRSPCSHPRFEHHVPHLIAQESVQPRRLGHRTAYVASNPLYVGGVARLRLYVHIETGASSPLTTVTVKVQQRYSQPSPPFQLGWVDTASDDAAGTRAVEHAFTVSAAGEFDFALVLDPLTIPDLQVLVKANAQGGAGDSVSVFIAQAV
jgi:hypothetical protein